MNKSADEADQFSLQTASPYRSKARHRLIGALALVVLVAIIMPIFFHAEPRIPSAGPKLGQAVRDHGSQHDKHTQGAAQASEPPEAADAKSVTQDEQNPQPSPDVAVASSQEGQDPLKAAKSSDAVSPKQDVQAKNEQATRLETSAASDAPAKAPARIETAVKSDQAEPTTKNPYPERYPDRYVLQAGAFSQSESADAQVARLKKLGFKVYTDRIKTPKGERVRVRVGPFATKADAVKAQTKLRQAQLEAPLAGPDA